MFQISIFYFNFIKDGDLDKIGQRERLSEKDILKLNLMYECDNAVEPEPEPEPEFKM